MHSGAPLTRPTPTASDGFDLQISYVSHDNRLDPATGFAWFAVGPG